MLLGILFWKEAPIVAIQLLFINVVADGVPDLCMCREPAEKDVMRQKPVRKNESIFARGVASRITLYGAVFAVVSLIGYYIGAFIALPGFTAPSHEVGRTMAYLVIGWSSVVNIFNIRSRTLSIFQVGILSNVQLFFALCFSLTILTLMPIVPIFMTIFHTVPIAAEHWLWMILLSIPPLVAIEIHKIFLRWRMKRDGDSGTLLLR